MPGDYPMVAPNYAETRARMAKAIGLGRKARKRRREPERGIVGRLEIGRANAVPITTTSAARNQMPNASADSTLRQRKRIGVTAAVAPQGKPKTWPSA